MKVLVYLSDICIPRHVKYTHHRTVSLCVCINLNSFIFCGECVAHFLVSVEREMLSLDDDEKPHWYSISACCLLSSNER